MQGSAGRTQFFQLDNAAGTLTNLTANIANIDFPVSQDLEDSTTLGDTGHEFTFTLTNGTISVSLVWDATIEAHLTGLIGLAASQTFEYGPVGNTSGFRRKTGECRVSGYQVGAPVGGIVMATLNLQIDGAVTYNTFP